ncbi:MAG: SDR family NAD(P)-dependent oxidoreductase [Thermoleophilia bacterium]
MGTLEGKVCLVTGSSGGLGRAFCRKLASEGALVAAAGRSLERLHPVTSSLPAPRVATDPGHLAVELDTGDWESVAAGVARVKDAFGRIDVLVNNAAAYGDLTRAPFDQLPIEEWDRVMATNVRGPWFVSRAVAPIMRGRQSGRIINITSATFWSGSANWAHYVASKGAIIGLTRVMAKELGAANICVNAVAPGFTMTEASLGLIPGAESYGIDRGSIKRAQQPEDVVGVVAFLASDEAGFITGQTIIVDGGREFN